MSATICPEVADKPRLGGEIVADRDTFDVHTRTRDGREDRLRARAVVIATGGFGEPNRLDLPDGEPDGRVIHYYKEPFPFFDQDVIVVGGGNSAVEAALELHRNGVRVRMVHFADVFDRGVKPWVRPDIDNRIEHGEIVMHWKSRIEALGPRTATILRDDTGAATEVANDWVVAMTGWRPDHTLLQRPRRADRSPHGNPRPRPRDHGDERPRRLHRGGDRGGVQREQDLHREWAGAWGADWGGGGYEGPPCRFSRYPSTT